MDRRTDVRYGRAHGRPPRRRSCTPTSTRSTPRSSSSSTRPCGAAPSPSAAAWCWRRRTRPRPTACRAGCRAGGPGSCAPSSCSSAATSASTNAWATPPSRCCATSPRWSSASRSTRRSPTSPVRSTCSGPPRRHGRDRAHPGARRARPAHLGRRGHHQAPGQGGVTGRQARRAGRGGARHRAGVPRSAPVGLLWGVGPVTEAKLASAGIGRIGELAAAQPELLRRLLGQANGAQARRLAVNADPRPIETARRASLGGGPVGPRARASPRRRAARHARLPRRPGGHPPAGRGARRPHRHRPGAVPRHAERDPLDHPARADRRPPSPSPRSASTWPGRRSPTTRARREITPARDLGVAPGRRARPCSWRCRSACPTTSAGRAPPRGRPGGPSTVRWTGCASASAATSVGYAAVALSGEHHVPEEFRELVEKPVGDR